MDQQFVDFHVRSSRTQTAATIDRDVRFPIRSDKTHVDIRPETDIGVMTREYQRYFSAHTHTQNHTYIHIYTHAHVS